jgi:ribose transport system substrate-binding protein
MADNAIDIDFSAAVKKNISIVAINADTGVGQFTSCVGSNHYKIGQTLADEIKSRFSGGVVAVLSDIETSAATKARASGFSDKMAENTEFSILETAYCDADPETAKEQTIALMAENKDLTAIVCLSEQATVGTGRAIEETGNDSIFLAGTECSEEAVWLLERGILDVALLQNSYAMGYFSVEAAVKNLRGVSVEKVIETEFSIITKENMFTKENQQLIFPLSSY